MELAVVTIAFVVAAAVAAYSTYSYQRAVQALLDEERRRTADWWKRSQKHIDNLQDRVMAKEFETYVSVASSIERPGDGPIYSPDVEFGETMAADLLKRLREQPDEGYGTMADIAEDYAGPIVG